MDARLIRLALVVSIFSSLGATYKTTNFVVTAPTPEFAKQVGDLAEHYREEIAMQWLGKTLPNWYKPCPISVKVGQIGAGGATSFAFDRDASGEMQVFGWRMNVQGSEERILDSVLPHEISHTIFACYFRRPLPRWADEGAATLVEHESERKRQVLLLNQVLKSGRQIPLRKLLAIKEYPSDMQSVMTLYAEGYSLADFLVQAGGRTRYLQFLDDAHRHGWDRAIASHYELNDVDHLEERWNGWVMAGSPRFNLPEGTQLADGRQPQQNGGEGLVVRGQNADAEPGRPDMALAAVSPRNVDLTAPEPGRNRLTAAPTRKGLPASTSNEPMWSDDASAGAGRERAVNDGWIPVAGDRLPRPQPTEDRFTLPTGSPQSGADSRGVVETAEDLDLDQPVFEPADVDDTLAGRRHPYLDAVTDGRRSAARGRSVPRRASDWSDFPPSRTSASR